MTNVRDLMRSQQYYELSDADGESPIDAAIRETRERLDELLALKAHAHAYDERGFCSICGWDGNA